MCQQLLSTSLDLNSGGVIYDVVYDKTHNGYFVVGNFSSIGGVPVQNIAFINESDYTVNTAAYLNPVLSIDGEIRTIALEIEFNIGCSCWKKHLYLGGNFGTVEASNGTFSRKGVVKMTSDLLFGDPLTATSSFGIVSWNPDLDMPVGSDQGVNDIEIYNDTVHLAGEFLGVNSTTSLEVREGLAAYNMNTGALLSYPGISLGPVSPSRWLDIEQIDNRIYICGDINLFSTYTGKIYKLDETGNVDPSFSINESALRMGYGIHEVDDSLLAISVDRNAYSMGADLVELIRKEDGSEKTDHPFSHDGSGAIGGVGGVKHGLSVYKNYMFNCSSIPGSSVVGYNAEDGGTSTPPYWNANATNFLTPSWFGQLHHSRNNLFVSAPNLSTLSGNSRNRLGVYCLEPDDPLEFTNYDTTVCPGQTVLYGIPIIQNAEGYLWQYSGSGADIDLSGSPENLSEILIGPAGATVEILFTDLFSPGVLSVTPFTTCNGNMITSDTLFGNPLTLNIQSNPLPNINISPDSSLSCQVDTIVLSAFSDTSGCTYEWLNPGPWGNSIGNDTTATTDGLYIFKATSSIGCPNYDTVTISIDTIAPDVILPPPPHEITCSDSLLLLIGSTTIIDSVTSWRNVGTGTLSPNPVGVSLPGNYRFIVQDISNGCKDSLELVVSLNQPSPNIKILGYMDLDPASSLDTLTCFLDTLSLEAYSDSSNTILNWTLSDTSMLFGNIFDISSGGNYFLLAEDTVTGCTNFTGVNIAEFFNVPDNIILPQSDLSCSVDSIILSGYSSLTEVDYLWIGDTISVFDSLLTVITPGWYHFTVSRLDNGCSVTDSVEVEKTFEILTSIAGPTVACQGDTAVMSVLLVGSIIDTAFNWSNGSTTNSTYAEAGVDSVLIVEVSSSDGCYGQDTIFLNIPPPATVDIATFQPCGDPASGQLVITPTGGWTPFNYSINDGSSIQSSTTFDSLNMGSYSIVVYDSMGCDYSYVADISQASDLPSPSFLVSTNNYFSDTIILINTSIPVPDEVEWIIPIELNVIESNFDYALLEIPDTGIFSIELVGNYGTCSSSYLKSVSASEFADTIATLSDPSGIKSISVFPNPTANDFALNVEFYKAQSFSIILSDPIGETLLLENYPDCIAKSVFYSFPIELSNGSYHVKLIAEYDAAYITIILNR